MRLNVEVKPSDVSNLLIVTVEKMTGLDEEDPTTKKEFKATHEIQCIWATLFGIRFPEWWLRWRILRIVQVAERRWGGDEKVNRQREKMAELGRRLSGRDIGSYSSGEVR